MCEISRNIYTPHSRNTFRTSQQRLREYVHTFVLLSYCTVFRFRFQIAASGLKTASGFRMIAGFENGNLKTDRMVLSIYLPFLFLFLCEPWPKGSNDTLKAKTW